MLGCRLRSFIQILCIYLFLPLSYQNRRYDIEAECLKLYKEDFPTVLMRFRRSPEYVKILEDMGEDFDMYVEDVKTNIQFFYLAQLEKKIAEMVGYNPDQVEEGVTTEPPKGYLRYHAGRRADEESNITAVERLDSYSKLSSSMTVNQRNAMKDLGFQYAGHVLHALIKNMGADRTDAKSTVVAGQTPGQTTTEHVSVHSITFDDETTPAVEKPAGRDGVDIANLAYMGRDGVAQPQKRFQKKD